MGNGIGRTANCLGERLVMKPITSYADVINAIAQPILAHTLAQQIEFVKQLIYQFVQDLPADWLDNELTVEKPHFQTIVNQITGQQWQDEILTQQLDALDDIMFDMGDAYPHQTSEPILLILDLLEFYLALKKVAEKSEVSDGWTLLAAESYLDYYDQLMETNSEPNSSEPNSDAASSFDDWLAHPITKAAFDNVQHALIAAKNN